MKPALRYKNPANVERAHRGWRTRRKKEQELDEIKKIVSRTVSDIELDNIPGMPEKQDEVYIWLTGILVGLVLDVALNVEEGLENFPSKDRWELVRRKLPELTSICANSLLKHHLTRARKHGPTRPKGLMIAIWALEKKIRLLEA